MNTKSEILNVLSTRGYSYQFTDEAGLDKLLSNQKIKAYIGFDCTAPSLHVGSLIQIMMLRILQRFGHTPIVLLGGGTTKIGDPSGKDEMRSVLSHEKIEENKIAIKGLLNKFLDGAIFVDNAEWLDHLNYIEFLSEYGRHFSINKMLTFDSVKLRLDRQQSLSFLEFNYMLLQAYDFLELFHRHNCVLQLGGSDQWGNIVSGIDLARRIDNVQLFGLTSPLMTTSSGAKMGKTAGGAVWLSNDLLSSYDYWQFWRNTDDADVVKFLKLFTDIPLKDIEELSASNQSPINELKILLANEATKISHGEEAAREAMSTARDTFEGGGIGSGLKNIEIKRSELTVGIPAFKLFVESGLCSSGGEARRLISGGGARINNEVVRSDILIINLEYLQNDKMKLSAGKKNHVIICCVE